MDGLDQRLGDDIEIAPVRRYHAHREIGGLDMGIEEIEPGYVEMAHRPDGDEDNP